MIIDDIGSGTVRADARIRRETQRIEETRRKEKTYCTCGETAGSLITQYKSMC